jgi:hypothetical protein
VGARQSCQLLAGIREHDAFASTHLKFHSKERLQLLDLAAVEALLSGITPGSLGDASSFRNTAEVVQAVESILENISIKIATLRKETLTNIR